MQIQPYLSFQGNCEEAFKFYAQILGGKIEALHTFAGSPMENQIPQEWSGKVMHAQLVAQGQVLLGSDPPPQHYSKPEGFSISLSLKDVAEAERIYKALSEKGTVKLPLQQTFWAKRFGMFIDQFSIPWMINCE